MFVRTLLTGTVFLSLLSNPGLGTATDWYVDGSVAASGGGQTWSAAFKSIQEGIDAASDGDTVSVAPGIYLENVEFKRKNIVLRSTDPSDPSVVSNTVIDGNQAGSVVTFDGIETEACLLSGFTIRNGKTLRDGGGIKGNGTRATITGNVVIGNSADRNGGGLDGSWGVVQNNTISGNEAGCGGAGLASCSGRVEDNVISENTAGAKGGGLSACSGPISNNVISNNEAGGYGGGLSGCSYVIESNAICWNSAASHGGGLAYCSGALQNNTIYGNRAGANGGGLCRCRGSIRNCIIWGNEALESGNQVHESSIPLFSCVQDWDGTGEGSTGENPLLVDPDGPDDDPSTYDDNDYHLQAESPCINRGVNYYWLYWPQRDLDRNCRLVGQQVDIGCYEFGASFDSDGDLLSDQDEAAAATDPDQEDTDGDGLRDGLEILRGSNPAQKTAAGIIHVPTDMPTIQRALCLALEREEIVVSPGVYRENIHFSGPDVVLRGSDPHDPDVVPSIILDGGGAAPVVCFMGTESEACILSGVTIRNGAARWGGGIRGGGRATILNNVITGNSADYAGGIVDCRGIIRNNTICRNHAWGSGGGLASCHGLIQSNTISGNSAGDYGGGLIYCDGVIQSNIISGNSSDRRGGGLQDCHGTIRNNIIHSNSAAEFGGGLYHCLGIIQNNTIYANSAPFAGGGMATCYQPPSNCIIWGNTAGRGAQLDTSGDPTYSCIEGWSEGGQGNINLEPRFVDAENADFRLLPDSPCIDTGDSTAPDLPVTDIAGMPRVMYGRKSPTVDMGAYEYYINDVEPGPEADETTLTWSSLAGKTYSILYSDDLHAWHLADDSVVSAGNMTSSWTDDGSKTGIPPSLAPRRFYRILENP